MNICFMCSQPQFSYYFCSSFKLFLELEPQAREMLHAFYASKYGVCLRILNEMKDTLLLDIYLAKHVNYLYTQIRNRALCQVSHGVIVS